VFLYSAPGLPKPTTSHGEPSDPPPFPLGKSLSKSDETSNRRYSRLIHLVCQTIRLEMI
jgi:hypothetical protein